jgi:hypothetical protein
MIRSASHVERDVMPIDDLIDAMTAREGELHAAGDARRFFHSTYLRTTRAVRDEIAAGRFADGEWVEEWDVVFAQLYLDADAAWEATGTAVGPWQLAFLAARDRPELPPLRHVLLGMNAHINYDLAQALVAAIPTEGFDDPGLLARRGRDHEHIDTVLLARVAEEDRQLEAVETTGQRSWLDRLLTPVNRAGTARFLRESRRKVWANARVLDQARRAGPEEYRARLAELEVLSRARVADLLRSRFPILDLARKGFGVELLNGARDRRM